MKAIVNVLFVFFLILFVGGKLRNQSKIGQPGSTWVKCGIDGQTCYLPTSASTKVAYGANGVYLYTTAISKLNCGPTSFGNVDPVPYVVKGCYYDNATVKAYNPSQDWVECGKENETCWLPDSQERLVAYGANGVFYYRLVATLLPCQYTQFGGDPAPFVAKQCYYNDSIIKSQKPGQDAAWVKCGDENGICTFPQQGTYLVAYGANGKFYYKPGVSPFSCRWNNFNADPTPYVVKACYYYVNKMPAAPVQAPVQAPTTPTTPTTPALPGYIFCAWEGSYCVLPDRLGATVAFGANGNYTYSGFFDKVECVYKNWAYYDPAPGVRKACFYPDKNVIAYW